MPPARWSCTHRGLQKWLHSSGGPPGKINPGEDELPEPLEGESPQPGISGWPQADTCKVEMVQSLLADLICTRTLMWASSQSPSSWPPGSPSWTGAEAGTETASSHPLLSPRLPVHPGRGWRVGPTHCLVSLVSSLCLGVGSMGTCLSECLLEAGVGSRWGSR